MKEILDRYVANTLWLEYFSKAQVTHLYSSHLGHRSILLDTNYKGCKGEGEQKEKPFRFEKMWIGQDGCRQNIIEGWNTMLEENGVNHVAQKDIECLQMIP